MNTPPLFVLDGWTTLIKSNPGSYNLLSSNETSELRKVSERHKMLTLLFEIKPCESANFWKLEYYLDSSDKLKNFDLASHIESTR